MYSSTKQVSGMHFRMGQASVTKSNGGCYHIPSLDGEAYFVALTQPGPDILEHPIAFVARYLTKTVLKYSTLSTLVSVAAWAIRKLRCYTIFSRELHVILLTTVDI